MTAEDITPLFRSALTSIQNNSPPSRSKSPFRARSPTPKGKQRAQSEAFLKEAYQIHSHLTNLSTLLGTIKKAYLSTATAPLRRLDRGSTSGNGESSEGLEKWKDSRYLSDRERDEIDLRGKVILRRCKERVSLLEEQERARQKQINPPAVSTLYTFLPSLAPAPTDAKLGESLVSAHRSSVLWTLNDLMAKIGGEIASMQEERHKRREERSRNLGSQAEREAVKLSLSSSPTSTSTSNGLFSTKTRGDGMGIMGKAIIPETEPSIDDQLTESQKQQFQLENNALIEHMEEQLSTVLKAEKSLLEIAELQTELVRHLAMQTEITERLYDEAVGSVGEVGKANVQLKEARKRGEEGRLFLLVFLIGASLALLFLDWYA